MACFKCGSKYTALRLYEIRELKKGSPTRGKNKEYITIKVKEEKCSECQSSAMEYS